jgi:diaminohydroxyphosphoribosylaminopyrimidine deaminase / 5-amino-6-(5-phosphoribosylamino)uracil reductase
MNAAAAKARAFDRHMMAIALRMAGRGLGTTAFNPSVGAVVANEASGEVIARGWTQPTGRPHAEKEALRRAGSRAQGHTLYVTLEPCAHTGRVPTCADAVLSAGLKRVVCALPDPNPIIAGRGFAQLREAGILVDVGLMADEARALTIGHICHVTQQRPFVQVKLAVSANGRIAAGTGAPVWVTGSEARAQGHLLRARADLIVTGIETVLADDPQLDCRLPGLEARGPHRLIVDSRARVPRTARVLLSPADIAADRRVWLATSDAAAARADVTTLLAERNITGVHACGTSPLNLARLLKALAAEPVRRVLVEAGPRLTNSFIMDDLADEVVLFRGAMPLDVATSLEPLAGLPLAIFADNARWTRVDHRLVGPDEMTVYRRTTP